MPHRWICVAIVLFSAACQAPDAGSVPDVQPAAEAQGSPEPAVPTPVPPADTVPRLSADGWGPLRIGMTRAEVVAAAGEDANPEAVGGPEPEQCDEFRPRDAPAGMRVMLEQGRLTRISVAREAEVRTPEGFGVGSAAEEIRAAYGSRAESTPHKYLAAPAEYVTVWTRGGPEAPDARGIVYETGLDGRVAQVHAGSRSIQYVEGCL